MSSPTEVTIGVAPNPRAAVLELTPPDDLPVSVRCKGVGADAPAICRRSEFFAGSPMENEYVFIACTASASSASGSGFNIFARRTSVNVTDGSTRGALEGTPHESLQNVAEHARVRLSSVRRAVDGDTEVTRERLQLVTSARHSVFTQRLPRQR